MKRPKILFVLHIPPPIHGSAIVGKQIVNSELIREKFDCKFINISTSKKITEIGKKPFAKYCKIIKIYFHLFWLLCRVKYDLCYLAITVTQGGLLKDAPLVFLCKIFRKKIFIHQHNKGVALFQDKKLYHCIYRLIYPNTKVILLSWQLYSDIQKYIPKDNVYICPNGISETNTIVRGEKSKIAHILYLSNLIESKGCLVLLDACVLLKNKGIDFQCDYVGAETKEISKEKFLREIEIRQLSDCVVYHGPKYGNDKAMMFTATDLFVFPTFYEAFGLVNLEAMQYGLPIISTDEGGIPDIIDNGITGYIVEKRNPIELAERIEELIKNPELRESMGKAGRQKFQEQYTIECFENRLCEIFDANLK